MWFQIDDIAFHSSGRFSSQDRENAKGKWTHSDSELSLKFLSAESDEAIFETNLPAPGNRIRIEEGQAWFIPMSKWDYKVSVRTILDDEIHVRVERRPKT